MTREHGVVASAAGLVPFGHVGWGFRDRAELRFRAAEYIADGLAHHQRIVYVSDGTRETLAAELAAMGGSIGERVDSGDIQLTPVEEHYIFRPGSDVVDFAASIGKYVSAAEDAITQGYTGYRAVVDATQVVRSAEQRDAMASLEYLVDQKMAVLPFSALCVYNTSELGPAAAELICLHPFVGQGATSFRVYAQRDADLALTGEIDASSDELFRTTLHRTWGLAADDPVVIDAQGLQFISHRQLCVLDHYARTDGREVVLRTDQRIPVRMAALLGLTNIRVQPVSPTN